MSDTIESQIAAKVREQRLEDQAAKIALATPRPGPLRDVFASQQDIKVSKYSVRPFFDVDFEYLQELDHPLANCAVGNIEDLESFIPRGPKAWQLFWLMTTPVVEVDKAFVAGGPEAVKAAARAEFSKYQLGALYALYQAVVKQLLVYASSVVGYDSDSGESENDEKGAAEAKKSSAQEQTATAGS